MNEMRKSVTYTLLMLLPFIGIGQPIIDGSFDGSSVWGTAIGTNATEGWNDADAKELYMTSDDTYVYFGILVNVRRWYNAAVAINTGSAGSSTDPWGRNVVWNHANTPDVHIRIDFNGNSGNGYAELRTWNGSSWVQSAIAITEYASNINSSVNDNDLQTDRWFEIRIPRSDFGSADKLDVQFAILGNNNDNGNFNSIPHDNQQGDWNQQTTLSNFVLNNYITIRSDQGGDWDNAATWIGVVPSASHIVHIDHNITLNQNATVSALIIADPNVLTINAGQSLTINGALTNNTTEGIIIKSPTDSRCDSVI